MIKFKLNKQREAFSMIMAIVVIVVMGSLTVLVSNLTGKIGQETTALFQKEQAMLLAKSYTEYSIMAVSANGNRAPGSCIDNITSDIGNPETGFGYRIISNISYLGDGGVAGCDKVLSSNVLNDKSKLNIIVDVYVSYREIGQIDVANSPWLRYHKRSLQKI